MVKNLNIFISLIAACLLLGCPDPEPQIADCDPGYHPCEDDESECCLDTTNYSFTWETEFVGGYGTVLRNVKIVSDDNIWVVGEIQDTEYDIEFYGVMHWDGVEWENIQVKYPYMPGVPSIVPHDLRYIADNDIYFPAGDIVRWDGTQSYLEWRAVSAPNNLIRRVFERSPNDIYYAGTDGKILHYNGNTYRNKTSPINIEIKEIDGSEDCICMLGRENGLPDIGLQSNFLSLDQQTGEFENIKEQIGVFPDGPNSFGSIYSLWVYGEYAYILTYTGIWRFSCKTKEYELLWTQEEIGSGIWYYEFIRGNSPNDIFLVNTQGVIAHYNGDKWVEDTTIYDYYWSQLIDIMAFDVTPTKIVAVGQNTYNKPVVQIKRVHKRGHVLHDLRDVQ